MAGAAEPRFHGVYGFRAAAVCPTNSVLNTVPEIGNVLDLYPVQTAAAGRRPSTRRLTRKLHQ